MELNDIIIKQQSIMLEEEKINEITKKRTKRKNAFSDKNLRKKEIKTTSLCLKMTTKHFRKTKLMKKKIKRQKLKQGGKKC